MAASTTLRLRSLWLQLHKWLGILLAILIIPISLSGAALVWHDWLDETVNPERVIEATETELPAARYADAARLSLEPGERVMTIAYPSDGGAIMVTAARPPQPGATGRPVRTQLWLHPADGRVIDRASSDEGLVRWLHVLHGRLQIPSFGRQLVGWVGVAMLISALTGLWLWWPVTGSVRRGFRWKRQDRTSANLHHLTGFWIAIPLAMLSFTGMWISFPAFFGGNAPPAAAAQRPGPPPLPLERPRMSPDAALAAAQPHATGSLVSIGWPTDKAPDWTLAFQRQGGGNAEVKVSDASGTATPPSPPRPETTARTMRRWHDGTGMGVVWQVVIFLGGIIPALLAVTGILMWLRSRKWRGEVARKKGAKAG
jgi:uncharacterized iron-regulated membrane protein